MFQILARNEQFLSIDHVSQTRAGEQGSTGAGEQGSTGAGEQGSTGAGDAGEKKRQILPIFDF